MHRVAKVWPGATAALFEQEAAALRNDRQAVAGGLPVPLRGSGGGGLLIVGSWRDTITDASEQTLMQIDKSDALEGRPIQQSGEILSLQFV